MERQGTQMETGKYEQSGTGTKKKKYFAPILKDVLNELSPLAIENGFKKYGLVPWKPNDPVTNEGNPLTNLTIEIESKNSKKHWHSTKCIRRSNWQSENRII